MLTTWMLIGTAWIAILTALISRGGPNALLPLVPGYGAMALAWSVHLVGVPTALDIQDGPGVPVWTSVDIDTSVGLMFGVGVAMFSGATIGTALVRLSRGNAEVASPSLHIITRAVQSVGTRSNLHVAALLVAIALTAVFVLGYGPAALIQRDAYIPQYAIPAIATIPALPPAFIAAVYCASGSSRALQIIGTLVAIISALLAFAASSRLLGLFPIFLVLVLTVVGRRLSALLVLALIALSAVSVAVVLSLRNAQTAGLLPYAAALVTDPAQLIADGFRGIYWDIVFSVPLLGYVYANGDVSSYEMQVSLDPRSAGAVDWADVSRNLRVHSFIPFNGLGELASFSLPALIISLIIMSAFFTTAYGRLRTTNRPMTALVMLLTYIYVFVLLLQYNLRSSARIVYLALVLLIVVQAWQYVRARSSPASRRLPQHFS